eukprot:2755293-Rhodomonas_salina.2
MPIVLCSSTHYATSWPRLAASHLGHGRCATRRLVGEQRGGGRRQRRGERRAQEEQGQEDRM